MHPGGKEGTDCSDIDNEFHNQSCKMNASSDSNLPWFSQSCDCTLTCRGFSRIPQKQEENAVFNTHGHCFKCNTHLPMQRQCSNALRKLSKTSTQVNSMAWVMNLRLTTTRVMMTLLLVGMLLPSFSNSQPIDFNHNMLESLSSDNDGRSNQNLDGSPDDTELSAKEFLGKFGYVQPAEWTSVSPRYFGDSAFSQGIVEAESSDRNKEIGSGEPEKEPSLIKWSFDDISEEEYQRALIKYQRINGLNATGELDDDTRSYMGRPRCGVPDRTASYKVNKTAWAYPTTSTTTTIFAQETTVSIDVTYDTTDATTQSTGHNSSSQHTTGQNVPIIHSITTPNPDSSYLGHDPIQTTSSSLDVTIGSDGSGDIDPDDDVDQMLKRTKRSNELLEGLFQMEAGFEEITSATEDESFRRENIGIFDEFDLSEVRPRRVNFKDINDAPISEAELPDETRVASLETILEALRREKLSQINGTDKDPKLPTADELITTIRPTPATPVPTLVKKLVMDSRRKRRKRSNAYLYGKTNGWLLAYPKEVITWRLVEEWPTMKRYMSSNEIWFTIKLAFRMWSEVLPRNFKEDNHSPLTNVDILLGFGKKEHNRCPVPFLDGKFTREYAHAWPLPQAEVHFNDDQPFVSVTWDPSRDDDPGKPISSYGFPISLLKVAIHEIGHTLGLPHNKDRSSVMNPVYLPYKSKKVVELEVIDRRSIQRVYGTCNIAFDAVFDWVRQYVGADRVKRWKYNTFFFRNTWFWLYENRGKRPRYGDPKFSYGFWRGVLEGSTDPHRKIDGVVHIRDWSIPNGPVYFFTGDTFSEYDSFMDRVKLTDSNNRPYPMKIKEGFPGIPYPIDTVMYKWQEKLLYFFKGDRVYKFDWRKRKIVRNATISSTFPGWGGAASLPNNIDAAYYSFTDSTYYFFKGTYYWKLATDHEKFFNKGISIPDNAVGSRKLISSKWKYICDVDYSEMQMTLPPGKT